MIKIFTHDDVIRFAYQETNQEETDEIRTAIVCDPELMDLYNHIKKSQSLLDEIILEPSERATNQIMNYVRNVSMHSVNN